MNKARRSLGLVLDRSWETKRLPRANGRPLVGTTRCLGSEPSSWSYPTKSVTIGLPRSLSWLTSRGTQRMLRRRPPIVCCRHGNCLIHFGSSCGVHASRLRLQAGRWRRFGECPPACCCCPSRSLMSPIEAVGGALRQLRLGSSHN